MNKRKPVEGEVIITQSQKAEYDQLRQLEGNLKLVLEHTSKERTRLSEERNEIQLSFGAWSLRCLFMGDNWTKERMLKVSIAFKDLAEQVEEISILGEIK